MKAILPKLLHCCSSRRHPPLLVGCAQHRVEERSSPRSAFIPHQIKDYGVGIPACLANLRAATGLKTPDAIHGATAVASGCTLLLSNDGDFRKLSALPVVILDDVLV